MPVRSPGDGYTASTFTSYCRRFVGNSCRTGVPATVTMQRVAERLGFKKTAATVHPTADANIVQRVAEKLDFYTLGAPACRCYALTLMRCRAC